MRTSFWWFLISFSNISLFWNNFRISAHVAFLKNTLVLRYLLEFISMFLWNVVYSFYYRLLLLTILKTLSFNLCPFLHSALEMGQVLVLELMSLEIKLTFICSPWCPMPHFLENIFTVYSLIFFKAFSSRTFSTKKNKNFQIFMFLFYTVLSCA